MDGTWTNPEDYFSHLLFNNYNNNDEIDLWNGIIRRNVKTFGCRGQCNFLFETPRFRDFAKLCLDL